MTELTEVTSLSTGLTYLTNTPTSKPKQLILLIPGLGAHGRDFKPLLRALATHSADKLYIAVDLSRRSTSKLETSIDAFASALAVICEESVQTTESDIPRGRVLVGHSFGCRIALEMFRRDHGHFKAAVLLDGGWHAPKEAPEEGDIAAKALDPAQKISREIMLQHILGALETMFGPGLSEEFKCEQRDFYIEGGEEDEVYLTKLTAENRKWDGAKMVEALQAFRGGDGVGCRLLLLQATDGGGGPRRMLKVGEETEWMALARKHAGGACEAVVVEESGHWPHLSQTEEIAEHVLSLLE